MIGNDVYGMVPGDGVELRMTSDDGAVPPAPDEGAEGGAACMGERVTLRLTTGDGAEFVGASTGPAVEARDIDGRLKIAGVRACAATRLDRIQDVLFGKFFRAAEAGDLALALACHGTLQAIEDGAAAGDVLALYARLVALAGGDDWAGEVVE